MPIVDTSEKQEILQAIREGDESIKKELLGAIGELDQKVRDNGVMIEHVDSKVDAIAEQHGTIIQRLDGQAELLAQVAEDVTEVKDRVTALESQTQAA